MNAEAENEFDPRAEVTSDMVVVQDTGYVN